MPVHLLRDLDGLKRDLLDLGAMVEDAVGRAILALVDRRPDVAEEVRRGDRAIDAKEVRLESECLKLLALHQPVAADLRYVVAVMKVNNDLERMGDLAGNIAERAVALAGAPLEVPAEITEMADLAKAMVRGCLEAVVELDTDLARRVLGDDEEVDRRHQRVFEILEGRMRRDPETIGTSIQLLSVSRYLERLADLATNVAEDVVFMVEGEVIRHRPPPGGVDE